MAKKNIELNINGILYKLAIDPWRTLAEVLCEDLRLIDTKTGCNQGNCGACTIIINEKIVCACLILAVECHHNKIITIEGLTKNSEELHPYTRSFYK